MGTLAISVVSAAAAAAFAVDAPAQAFPTKPVRLIVAWGPGGAPDIFARVVGEKLQAQTGQPVIVDNRPGATGNVGAEIVARAPPDGYTIFNATLSLAISPGFYRSLPFDPLKSFAPVTMLASVPLILTVHPSLPAKSVSELIALAKSRPGALNYASVGSGSPAHVAGELVQSIAHAKLVHVPYKSGGAMVTAILSGEAHLAFIAIAPALPHARAGRVRVLAVTARKRSPAVPDVPTFAEAGLPGIEVDNWNGILAPARTPGHLIARLRDEIIKAVRAPGVAEQFARQGAEVNTSTPAEFSSTIRAEMAKWAKVVREAGIKPQ
jgi:tripartite-type tricarboxylate transporter receptor subunit TctC